eukprot:11824.XXX_673714_674208_1 [CDS] Oithona nana genome sequencing.
MNKVNLALIFCLFGFSDSCFNRYNRALDRLNCPKEYNVWLSEYEQTEKYPPSCNTKLNKDIYGTPISPVCPKEGSWEKVVNVKNETKCKCEIPCDENGSCKITITNWIFILISFIFTCF